MSNNPHDCLTPEEEARMELDYHLNATRWPIEDEGYLETLVDAVAQAIAVNGVGRPWDDFEEVNAFDLDHGDLRAYSRAAIDVLRPQTGEAGELWSRLRNSWEEDECPSWPEVEPLIQEIFDRAPLVRRPTYERIIELVEECRIRKDKSGESSRMMAKWISEGLNALYASPPSPAEVTDAMVLVPKEPTEGMLQAAFDVFEINPRGSTYRTGKEVRAAIYRAMITEALHLGKEG